MTYAHQPGSQPIDIPETIPNPVVKPRRTPAPAPQRPVKTPEKVPVDHLWPDTADLSQVTHHQADILAMLAKAPPARAEVGPETLIVVSSDLSHFHDYETARRLDPARQRSSRGAPGAELGPGHACGALPIAGLLVEAERRGLRARLVQFRRHGGRSRVVGYGAWFFEEDAGGPQ